MPVIKSAKKKLKIDKKRESANKRVEALINIAIKKAEKRPTSQNMQAAFKAIDKGVKKDIFHKNKGARIKSRLSKLIKKLESPAKTKSSKPTKKGLK